MEVRAGIEPAFAALQAARETLLLLSFEEILFSSITIPTQSERILAVIRETERVFGVGFQAIVRKRGYNLSRVLPTRKAALEWAGRVEAAIAVSGPDRPFNRAAWLPVVQQENAAPLNDSCPHGGWTVKQALERYSEDVTATKKGAAQEQRRIKTWCARPLAGTRLDALTTQELQEFAQARLASGKAGSTVRKDVVLLSVVYKHAATAHPYGWSLRDLANPAAAVKRPPQAHPRKRRLEDAHDGGKGEEQKIREAFAKMPRGVEMLDLLDLAIELGMRQSELLGITAGQYKRVGGVSMVALPDTKSGVPREVPLSKAAAAIIDRWRAGKEPWERLFKQTPADLRQRWRAALKVAGVKNLRWHDLRHESLTRMAVDKGMGVEMLRHMSGHRTVKVLLDYVNPSHQDVAKKLG